MFYLYVKEHNITGLKYLGQTCQDPYKYRGSGKYWKAHIKKHGYNVNTKILLVSENLNDIKITGLFFSKLWNIVKSSEWANLNEESGTGFSSNDSKRIQKDKLDKGTHPFQDIEMKSKVMQRRLQDKTHNFLGNKMSRDHVRIYNNQRVADGTHIFLNDFNDRMIKEGKHTSQNILAIQKIKNKLKERVENKEHNWIESVACVSEDGEINQILMKEYNKNKTKYIHINSKQGRKLLGKPSKKAHNKGITLDKNIVCPHCGTRGGSMGNMKRWHFNNCKSII